MDNGNIVVDDNHCACEAVPFVELNHEHRYILKSINRTLRGRN